MSEMAVISTNGLNSGFHVKGQPEDYGAILRQVVILLQNTGMHLENRNINLALRYLIWLRKNANIKILCTWLKSLWYKRNPDASMESTMAKSDIESSPFAELHIDKVLEALSYKEANDHEEVDTLIEQWKSVPSQVYCFLLLLTVIHVADSNEYLKAFVLGKACVELLMKANSRACDVLGARVYYFFALSAERTNNAGASRELLMRAHRTACLNHDLESQAALINCIFRSYIIEQNFESASKFASRVCFPASCRSIAQKIRFQYYLGVVEAVRLNYSESSNLLDQVLRKLSTISVGRGLRLIATKYAIVVELLMGDIPERVIFNQVSLRRDLLPYYCLVQAVKSGDIEAFKQNVDKYGKIFVKDRTISLIQRLRLDVIRAGLRMLCTAYSRIPLKDVANRLKLDCEADAEAIIAKAITDGVISGHIDPETATLECQNGLNKSSLMVLQLLANKIAQSQVVQKEARQAMHYPSSDTAALAENQEDFRKGHGAEVEDDDGMGDDIDFL